MDTTLATFLSTLGQAPATFGWDVVCAIQADLLSDLLARNYVTRGLNKDTQTPISGPFTVSDTVSIQIDNLILSEPLISITPDLQPGTFNLSLRIIDGVVSLIRTVNGVSYVASTQIISPGDAYTLQGVGSLSALQGSVQNGHDVTVAITDTSSFATNLAFDNQGGSTTLGQYLASLVASQSQLTFTLGTIIGSNTNLTPVSFKLSTQVDSTDPNDKGRLLLFIATQYQPGGGTQTSLAMNNVVPDGSTCTMIIAPGAFLQQIIAPALSARCTAPLTFKVNSSPFLVAFVHGLFNVGKLWFIDHANRNVFSWAGEASPTFSAGDSNTADSIVIPLDSGWMEPTSLDGQPYLLFQWAPVWSQGFYVLEKNKGATCQLKFSWGLSLISPDGAPFMAASVNPQTNTVSFDQVAIPAPDVDVLDVSNSDLIGHDEKKNVIDNVKAFVAQALPAAIPPIDAQSVSSLVLPGQAILSFEQVYFGDKSQDMILFGSVNSVGLTIDPVNVTLSLSGVQHFTATLPPGSTDTVTWHANSGSVSSDGLYTAPSRISGPPMDYVYAETGSGVTAAAFISLVPPGLSLAPDCAIVFPGSPSVQFVAPAAAAGTSMQYVLDPSTGCGSIDSNGNYSAPDSCASVQKVSVTAISNGVALGKSFLVLLPAEPSALAITPPSTVVLSGDTQTFTPSEAVGNWSAFSSAASVEISSGGELKAPYVSQPTCVVVVATGAAGAGYGVSVAVVEPRE